MVPRGKYRSERIDKSATDEREHFERCASAAAPAALARVGSTILGPLPHPPEGQPQGGRCARSRSPATALFAWSCGEYGFRRLVERTKGATLPMKLPHLSGEDLANLAISILAIAIMAGIALAIITAIPTVVILTIGRGFGVW